MIVFFMISGYIILHVINYENPIEFLIKRFFRIYPLLIFAILLEAILWYSFNGKQISYSDIFLQASLFGDFFNTPYSLAGVEWTLRVEIIFYILMAIISYFGFQKSGYILLAIFFIVTILLKNLAPFPSELFVGYFTIYFPFLFLGSAIYLFEQKKINFISLIFFVIFVFQNYFNMIEEFQTGWLTSNFAIVGFIIFILVWLNKNKLNNIYLNKYIILASTLTYSVYLFHNYLWFFIGEYLKVENKLIIFLILITFCFIVVKIIETPMNKIGKKIAYNFKNQSINGVRK